MKRIIATLIAGAMLSLPAAAEPYVNTFLAHVDDRHKRVRVVLHDNVKDGCWTNLGEVRTYAEDSMREAGWTVTDDGIFAAFQFTVSSVGWRHAGSCSVNVRVTFTTLAESSRVPGFHTSEVATAGYLLTGYGSANQMVLNAVGEVTKAIRDLPEPSSSDVPRQTIPAPAEQEL